MPHYYSTIYNSPLTWNTNWVATNCLPVPLNVPLPIYHYDAEGRNHCEDGPAIVDRHGNRWWARHGLWHREDGPAIEYASGEKEWYQHGKRHREDGPAVEHDGRYSWWVKGRPVPAHSQDHFARLMHADKYL